MESWNIRDVMDAMERKTGTPAKKRFVCFSAELGKNCCKACQENHGKIFEADDPERPEIPLHPNCRCKYIPID